MTTYTCWIPEYGHGREDGRPVKAGDPEHAACKYMEDYEARNAEYSVASGDGTMTVAVAVGDGPPEMFVVWGEARPTYYARRQHA